MWVIIILVVVGLAMVFMYNRLVALKNRVKNAWHQIDVQLKRRYDLIPNLVETVKGYARHEKEVFEKVTEARTKAMGASSVKEASEANNMLTSTLKSLFAVAEAYPELKANQNFLRLQEELTSTENKIAFARQFYNDVTMQFNISIQKVPLNLIAKLFNFKMAEYWEVPEGEKGPVEVKF
jgi:LemA protein